MSNTSTALMAKFKASGMTVRELSYRADVAANTLNRWLAGNEISLATVEKVATALGLTLTLK